jgi:hypothetical protein
MKTTLGQTIVSYMRRACAGVADPQAWEIVKFYPTEAEWRNYAFRLFGKELLFYGRHLPEISRHINNSDIFSSKDSAMVLMTELAIYEYLESVIEYTDIVKRNSSKDFDHRMVYAIERAAQVSRIAVCEFFSKRILEMREADLETFDLLGDRMRRQSNLVVDSAHERLAIAAAIEEGRPVPCSAHVRIKTAQAGWKKIPSPTKRELSEAKKLTFSPA